MRDDVQIQEQDLPQLRANAGMSDTLPLTGINRNVTVFPRFLLRNLN